MLVAIGKQETKKGRIDVEVGVREDGVPGKNHRRRADDIGRNAERRGQQCERARQQSDLHRVRQAGMNGVEIVERVVHGVSAGTPERAAGMDAAMHPVVDEVGEKEQRDRLYQP